MYYHIVQDFSAISMVFQIAFPNNAEINFQHWERHIQGQIKSLTFLAVKMAKGRCDSEVLRNSIKVKTQALTQTQMALRI